MKHTNFIKLIITLLLTQFIVSCSLSSGVEYIGNKQYESDVSSAKKENNLDESSKTALRIKDVFNRMIAHADKENETGRVFEWDLSVIKNDEINAFCYPGGKVIFYTGIVDKLNSNDDEIAAIMGHEMAHALKEHGKKTMIAAVLTSAISGAIWGDVASELVLNSYSRGNEQEADETGLFLMARAGYNPNGAVTFWQKAAEELGTSDNFFKKLISTHPNNAEREKNLAKLLPEAMKLYKASTVQEAI